MLPELRRLLLAAAAVAAVTRSLQAQQPGAGPAQGFRRTDVMIPMRDGVRLHAVVMAPAAATGPLPILLTRTPYGAQGWQDGAPAPPHLQALAADGYVFVQQDIRGRNRSEGVFVMNRPNRDAGDSTATDESTDTYDTVEWLLRHVPDNNGRVGIFGISYPGWLAEEALIGPHPAVKAVSPQAPMTDTWMGDDFFHQGAFRLSYGFEYGWGMEAGRAGAGPLPITRYDTYDWYRAFPSLKALSDATGALRIPTWRRFVEHPAYDSVWQARAFERAVTRVTVPTLTVGGFWDQEDLYGPQATFRALEQLDTAGVSSLVIGPWSHGQWGSPGGERLGNIDFGSATSDTFLITMQAPWFAYWLRGSGTGRFPAARLFDAGTDRWSGFAHWPPREAARRSLYLRADGRLSFDPPTERAGFDAYVSDPAHPVPYRPRPVEITYSGQSRWRQWMTEDQRFVDGRPDVLTWQTDPLAEDVTIGGDVTAHLFAATTGSDADWVVKLIDVYPDSLAGRSELGGYQLMVAGDIMRGRYRRSWEHPEAIRPNAVEPYAVDLHQQLYTFRRGHRIMVQVQSTWFPLYDRNPQTFVPNIFEAPPSAYRAETHRIYRTAARPSSVEVMVLPRVAAGPR
jgi:putative CocE/NonD family hydrolase